ncbi:Rid family hydrolase [Xanthocytophaga agilis]|uniref:Rid family hydrolase n=1 Tax=Xanthocytophaga agilis TaxID=3048010 RepID=A0AAE3RAZ5_9BACT|nr:Rid family hydrolase [Xanthocytophaga agilis]MDJ1506946.1 Rid family hydrolase [Xanthocytophaga agilis]
MTKRTLPCWWILLILINFGCNEISDTKTGKQSHTPSSRTASPRLKKKWHWGNKQKPYEAAGNAQVAKTGNTIYVSGIPTSNLSPEGIRKVYGQLEKCLNAFGASSEDVVKETLYTTNIQIAIANKLVKQSFVYIISLKRKIPVCKSRDFVFDRKL